MALGTAAVTFACALLSIVSTVTLSRDIANDASSIVIADSAGSSTLPTAAADRSVAWDASGATTNANRDTVSTSSTLASPRKFIAEFLVFSVEPAAPPDFMSTLKKAIREDRTFQLATARSYERKGTIRMWGNPRLYGAMGGGAGLDTPRFRMRCAFEPAEIPTEVRCVVTMTFVDKNKRSANVREVLSVAPGNTFHFVKLFRLAPAIGKEAAPWMLLLKIEEAGK